MSAKLVHVGGRQSRGADDHGPFVLDGLRQMVQRGFRCGEVDDDVAQGQGLREIVRQRDAEWSAAGHVPGIFAEGWVSFCFRGAGQLQPGRFVDEGNEAFAHSSGGAGDRDVDRGIHNATG